MKSILTKLIEHNTLTKQEARDVLLKISNQVYNPSQVSAFLTLFMVRSITIQELEGFKEALLELCVSVDLSEYDPMDFCGTGGDGKDTFNISTLASFVAAGAGINVAKHSNYGLSSICGSSNVLESLGIRLSNDTLFLKRCMDKAGICIIHAPLFHPALKNVGSIRKELGVKTFFNILGPLVNPVRPKKQVTGVYSLQLTRVYAYLNQNTDNNYAIVHALDGYDEVTLTGGVKIITNTEERIVYPDDFGVTPVNPLEISGGTTIEKSALIFSNVLTGKGTEAQNKVVCASAALGIAIAKKCSLKDAYQYAKQSLECGEALKRFETLRTLNDITTS